MVVILIEVVLKVHDVLLALAKLNSSQSEPVDMSAFLVYLGDVDDRQHQVLEVKYVFVPDWYPENDVPSTWCVDGIALLSECDCRMHNHTPSGCGQSESICV